MAKMPRMVANTGAADAFFPLKNLAFIPPNPDAVAAPLGNLE